MGEKVVGIEDTVQPVLNGHRKIEKSKDFSDKG